MNKLFICNIVILLLFTLSIPAKDYKGAEMFSNEEVKYGRFDIRMRSISGSGVVSAFFLYYNESYVGDPEPWCEIDIEILGKSTDIFQSNAITGTASNRVTSEKIHQFSRLSESYHTYSIEWAPDYLTWYFDGQEVRRTTGAQATDCQKKDMSYRFNAWITDVSSWGGAFNPSILPVCMYINWISYSSYTPGTGDGGSDFTKEWQDDFDTLDTLRWGKGDWTFDGNIVDFTPDNIVVKDGYCIICLTNAEQTGFSGTVPKDGTTSVNNPGTGSVLTITPLQYTNPQRSFIVNLTGRLLPDASQKNRRKLSPGLWVTKKNTTTQQKSLFYCR